MIVQAARTFYDKLWDTHVVASRGDGTDLLWIDRHLLHEVSSPQAFEGLRGSGRTVLYPALTLAVADHNVPTRHRDRPLDDRQSAAQLALLDDNARHFGIGHLGMDHPDQGIVHVIGPERGFTLPGLTVVCGDSHTATHGALGALGFGIGTSEIEHVLATQTLWLRRAKTMNVELTGQAPPGVTAKDIALALIGLIGAGGATGCVIEYTGPAVLAMSVEARMTLCNMAIEAGARSGIVAPDETTFAYLKGRDGAPVGDHWGRAVASWRDLAGDAGACHDHHVTIDVAALSPMVSWGTSPEQVAPITGHVPSPDRHDDPARQAADRQALAYMDLAPGLPLAGLAIQNVFIGSCTNSRIEDLRAAADIARGRHISPHVRQALVVPGSRAVQRQAEAEGLDTTFIAAGFSWREPGCSMCLGMNPDRVPPGERCAATSNRNFVGRQGPGARTHLLSPAMAAAAAIAGRLVDVRDLME